MSFRAIFSPKSCKTIKSFDSELRERIKNGIMEICNDPWEKGTIKVKVMAMFEEKGLATTG